MKLKKLLATQERTFLFACRMEGRLHGFDKRCAKTVRAMKSLEKLGLLTVNWITFSFYLSGNKELISAYVDSIVNAKQAQYSEETFEYWKLSNLN